MQLFDRYARRIRHLTYSESHGNNTTIDPSVYVRIHQLKKHKPIIPCLHTFVVFPTGPGFLSLLSPSIRSVTLFSTSENRSVGLALLDVLADSEAFPDLTAFHVEPKDLPIAFLQCLPQMIHLRQLTLLTGSTPSWHHESTGVQDLGLFAALSTLKHLENLSVQFSPQSTLVTQPETPLAPFPALHTLHIRALSTHLKSLLEILPRGGLQSLTIDVGRNDHDKSEEELLWTENFKTIGCKSSTSLKELHIKNMKTLTARWTKSRITVFEPLLEIHGLEIVSFKNVPWMLFNDEEFSRFASAWTMIRELHFPVNTDEHPPATILALQSFALSCPHLRTLSILFNAEAQHGLPLRSPSHLVSSSGLKEVNFGSSPIEYTMPRVVRHLDRLFPSLEKIRDIWDDDDNEFSGKGYNPGAGWNVVRAMLPMFQAVREDERARRDATSAVQI
jgi:hypothetical protein